MANIQSFLGKKMGVTSSRVGKYAKNSKGKSKKEKRELERNMLAPTKLQKHIGKEAHQKSSGDLSVRVFFPDKETLDVFGKYFKVSTYQGNNTHKIGPLVRLLQMLEDGKAIYDEEEEILMLRK